MEKDGKNLAPGFSESYNLLWSGGDDCESEMLTLYLLTKLNLSRNTFYGYVMCKFSQVDLKTFSWHGFALLINLLEFMKCMHDRAWSCR